MIKIDYKDTHITTENPESAYRLIYGLLECVNSDLEAQNITMEVGDKPYSITVPLLNSTEDLFINGKPFTEYDFDIMLLHIFG